MIKVNIKPLSVNCAWKGRRFKSDLYKAYEKELPLLLPYELEIDEGELEVFYRFGFSNKLSDWDNPIKQFQDILQKTYGFNDSQIMRATVEKVITKKGEEFIEFDIKKYK